MFSWAATKEIVKYLCPTYNIKGDVSTSLNWKTTVNPITHMYSNVYSSGIYHMSVADLCHWMVDCVAQSFLMEAS